MADAKGHDLTREVAVACRLAKRAGAEILAVRKRGFRPQRKADQSPVTQADLAADEVLRAGLAAAFPGDGILSEESDAPIRGTTGRTWIIDPLDGTRGFVAGRSDYLVQIGLLDGTSPVLGVLYEPETRRLYHAVRGQGAFLREDPLASATPTRLRVSDRDDHGAMRLVTSSRLTPRDRGALLDGLGMLDAGPAHSVGVKVGMLVRDEADVYVSVHPVNLWDSCGPFVVLIEAGGCMTLTNGRPLRFDLDCGTTLHQGPILATNGTRHDDLSAAVTRILGP